MQQMARRVIGRASRTDGRAGANTIFRKLLSDVSHARDEASGAFRVFLIRAEQMPVRSEHRAATTGVSYYRLALIALKDLDILPRQRARAFQIAGVRVQRATAGLAFRDSHRATICFQHAAGRGIDSLKQTLGYTG